MEEEFPGLVIVKRDYEVLSTAHCDLARLMSCTHEEADTRMFVHASDGDERGTNKILHSCSHRHQYGAKEGL